MPEEYTENLEKTKALYEKVKRPGKTVGPKAPPKEFDPVEFLSYIIELKHEAYELGWITNEGILESLDKKLENARGKTTQEKISPAINILRAFLHEVEAQSCRTYEEGCLPWKHIIPGGYALMYFNVM